MNALKGPGTRRKCAFSAILTKQSIIVWKRDSASSLKSVTNLLKFVSDVRIYTQALYVQDVLFESGAATVAFAADLNTLGGTELRHDSVICVRIATRM